jgi:GAF domain
MLPQSDDRFDLELAGWFSLRGGAWSGTASELLASVRTRSDVDSNLWPQSPRGLYTYLEFHRESLQSLGLDVLLHQGVPRMVSLRSCQKEQPPRQPPSGTLDLDRTSDAPINLSSLLDGQNAIPADSGNVGAAAGEAFDADIPIAESDLADRFVNGKYGDGDSLGGSVFENTGEALFAILEMRRWIRERSLDLESTVDLVIARARQITRCCGIAVGFLPQEIGCQFRTGMTTSRKELDFDANLFQSSLVAGEAVQLPDAQKHPLLGATCRRAGIGSLIMVPIFRNREVAGAMEFLYQEKRSFTAGEVMDLGLIAGVISDSLGGAGHIGVKQAEGRKWPPETKTVKNVGVQPGNSLKEKAGPGDALPSPVKNTTDAETPLIESYRWY